MEWTSRDLTAADGEGLAALRHEAFGAPRRPETPSAGPRPGQRWLGALDAEGHVVGRVASSEFSSWWGGEPLPTCGVVGVGVTAEAGGHGVMRDLLHEVLRDRHAAGDTVAGLYGTAPGIYRSSGFEIVADLVQVEIPIASLTRFTAPADVEVRRARPGDVADIRALYTAVASRSDGPLTRTGPLFEESTEDFLAEVSGYSLVRDGTGRLLGYAGWERTGGYHPRGRVQVHDLVFTTRGAAEALLAVLSGFASVCDRVRLWTSEPDPLRHLLADRCWEVVERRPYSLRVIDIADACTRRGWPQKTDAELRFVVVDPVVAANTGHWRLVVSDGRGSIEPVAEPDPDPLTLGIGAFTLLWSGAETPGDLRRLGLLSGGSPDDDAAWAALARSRPLRILDYY